ncbi:XRE family transcriptional regulator [Bacillus aquiflavi]|uniref:ImmA/IrrE family metallo-endopeptidase n=1 Tax=Bacillus aquiflavi TaxID=2672567 RepID=A0A6B3VW85_9BACI|nr:XRE family transcriptional regulator [Bacillus aquiflavi]MBA4538150.1 XRE family transcriptional regulator [Bacillus aquiflavi]NEY82470.1 ImmA/IrrE family metallo-endopeptidase [Bacillus aquiflavi]
MFIGKSLTNIRILHDLSRNQLAEKVGVTEQAIWQYENGYTSPKLEVINKLKTIFKVKSSYFYKEDMLSEADMNNIQTHNIAYRSETINSLNKTQSESMHIRFIDVFLKKIERKINYPKNILLELRNDTILFFKKNCEMDRDTQIKCIAELARNKIGLRNNSNKNFLFLLEKAGAFIFEKEIGETIDAYSLWSKDDRPYIILGSIKKSAVRRNFDLAHELGHLLLHYKVEFTMQDKKSYRQLEDEANQFASMFLLPEDSFRKDCNGIVKVSNPDAYLDLKQKWHVSLQAIAMRALKLKIINYQQYRYFFMSINKKGYKFIEPLDYEIPINRPMKMKSILQLLFDHDLYSVSDLMDELKVDQSFLTVLTGIEEEFFTKHRQKENKNFTVSELTFKS